MTEGQPEPLSKVTPFMVAALLCDAAATDVNSGKKSLVGIFDSITALVFPTQRTVTFYGRFTDAEGRYQMTVKFVALKDGEILFETKAEILVRDRLAFTELELIIDPLVVPEAGRYELQLWANSAFVGSTSIVAREMPHQPPLQR